MGQLKLPRQPEPTLDEVNISIRGELKRALDEHVVLYESNYGDDVAVSDFVPAILKES